MTLEQLRDVIPEFAKDQRLNLSTVLAQQDLTPRQAWGSAVACAAACRNAELLEAVLQDARSHLTPVEVDAALAAAAIMGMNNIYYRFKHQVANEKYRTMPARLRMNIIRRHGADPVDFELWCAAVSAINGCAACVDSHERAVREKGLSEEQVLASVRIASVLYAVATALESRAVAAAQAAEAPVPVAGSPAAG